MRARRGWLGWRLAAGLFAVTTALPVRARADARDAPAAQALFDQARAWMDAGRYAEACTRLEESQRLDPGAGTLYHLAKCYEADGRTASAWATYQDVASMAAAAHEPEREQLARTRAALLEPQLAHLTIDVPAGAEAAAVRVTRDGRVLHPVEWGAAVPLDPGAHHVHAEVPGALPFDSDVRVAAGADVHVSVVLAAQPVPSAPPAASTPALVATPLPPPSLPPRDAPRSNATARVAWGLAGGGIAACAASGLLLGLAKHADSESASHCSEAEPNACDSAGVEQRERAFRFAHGATALAAVGGAALVGALATWLIGRPRSAVSPARSARAALLVGPAGMAVRRSF